MRKSKNFFPVYNITAAAAAKSLQSCPTLCDPIDGSPPGTPVPGILQARTLEWVAISFSSAWKWKVKVKSLSSVQVLVTPWTAAYQAPPSMGFSKARVLEWVAILKSWINFSIAEPFLSNISFCQFVGFSIVSPNSSIFKLLIRCKYNFKRTLCKNIALISAWVLLQRLLL